MPHKSPLSSGVIQLQHVTQFKISQARTLRQSMTATEKILWKQLRGQALYGIKFRRQQIIEGFIVDFFCPEHKLVIEVDGAVHDTHQQREKDSHRRKVFEARGLSEIRFSNQEVTTHLNEVLQKIAQLCGK